MTGLVVEPPKDIIEFSDVKPVDVVLGAAAPEEVLVAVEPNPNVDAAVEMGAFPKSESPPEPKLDRPERS